MKTNNKENNDGGDEFATDMNDFDKHDNDPVVARNSEIIANSTPKTQLEHSRLNWIDKETQ